MHAKSGAVIAAINLQSTLHLLACLHGHGAFFDHQLWSAGFRGDHTGNIFDGAQVGRRVGQRGSSHANKNSVTGAHRSATLFVKEIFLERRAASMILSRFSS